MVRPSQAISRRIRQAWADFTINETCYRYTPKLSDENAVIADWLVRLTYNQKNWGFGLCFLHLRNVKGFGWNHKRVYRIYRKLELNLRINGARRHHAHAEIDARQLTPFLATAKNGEITRPAGWLLTSHLELVASKPRSKESQRVWLSEKFTPLAPQAIRKEHK